MLKAPHDLKAGDVIVGQARCLLKVTEVHVIDGAPVIGARAVRTTFVSPFVYAEEIALDGSAMIDVWDATEGER